MSPPSDEIATVRIWGHLGDTLVKLLRSAAEEALTELTCEVTRALRGGCDSAVSRVSGGDVRRAVYKLV